MSKKRLLIANLKSFLLAGVVTFALNLFFDIFTSVLILLVGYFIYVIFLRVLGRRQAKQGNKNAEIFPKTDDIPDELKENDKQLQSLGFVQMGTVTNRYRFKKVNTFVYCNASKNIIAYQAKNNSSRVAFSSYLADGVVVVTEYPSGVAIESEKIIRRIVKSDLDTAIEYHTHHVRQQMPEHGIPQKFDTIRDILVWEDRHQIGVDNDKSSTKIMGNFYLRLLFAIFIFTPILSVISILGVDIVFMFFGVVYEDMPKVFDLITKVIIMASLIICILWAYRPLYKSETVEDRKKKELA